MIPPNLPALRRAGLIVRWDRVLGDAAFDSEENHRLCREDLGVRFPGTTPGDYARGVRATPGE
jgi:hypothetical protein